MFQPIEITVGGKNMGAENVSHEYYLVNARDRYQALKRLADANPSIFSVIFCRTKRDTQKVAELLIEDGYSAGALHGDLSQNQRDLVMKSFRTRQIQMLVATDVAARGIDVDDITHVINYQLPDEIETYTHRSGRTGRAGKTGVSMVIVSKSENRKIHAIEKIIQKKFIAKEVPSGIEICEVQLFHLANKIKETEINHEIDTYLPNINEVLADFSKEELIKKVFSVEFTRFYNYYKKAKDLNVAPGDMSEGSKDTVRYFINIGGKDDFDWMSLKDFLKEMLQLGKDELYKVDVKDSFSFFNTDTKHQELVMNFFKDFELEGRRVSVEVSKDTGRGRRGGRDRGRGTDRGRGRDHGGFKGRSGERRGNRTSAERTGGKRDGRRGDEGKKEGGRNDRSRRDSGNSGFKGRSRRKSERPNNSGTGGRRRNRN